MVEVLFRPENHAVVNDRYLDGFAIALVGDAHTAAAASTSKKSGRISLAFFRSSPETGPLLWFLRAVMEMFITIPLSFDSFSEPKTDS
jgi:hypothetical protein